jgi:hypothetical protein
MAEWHGVTDWEQGAILFADGTNIEQTNRIRTIGFIPISEISAVKVRYKQSSGVTMDWVYVGYDANGNFAETSKWNVESDVRPVNPAVTQVRFVLSFRNGSTILPSNLMYFEWSEDTANMVPITGWEQGTLDNTGAPYYRTDRIRTSGSLSLEGVQMLSVRAFSTSGARVQNIYFGYDANGNLVDYLGTWQNNEYVYIPSATAVTAKFALRFEDNSEFPLSSLQSCSWDTTVPDLWQTQDGVNDGYPINTDNPTMPMERITAPYPRHYMRIDGVTNDGYPYLWWMRDEQEPDIGVNLLYMCGQQPQRLYYGTAEVQGCYYGGQLVYRPPSQL